MMRAAGEGTRGVEASESTSCLPLQPLRGATSEGLFSLLVLRCR